MVRCLFFSVGKDTAFVEGLLWAMLNHNSTRKMLLTLGCVFSFTLVCELLCLHGNSPSWMLWCSLQMRKFREIVNELLECFTLGRCRWKLGDDLPSPKTVLHSVTCHVCDHRPVKPLSSWETVLSSIRDDWAYHQDLTHLSSTKPWWLVTLTGIMLRPCDHLM